MEDSDCPLMVAFSETIYCGKMVRICIWCIIYSRHLPISFDGSASCDQIHFHCEMFVSCRGSRAVSRWSVDLQKARPVKIGLRKQSESMGPPAKGDDLVDEFCG